MARYNGFTCPRCGSHMFGTHTHHKVMGDKYPPGTRVGRCNEHQYSMNNCNFEWNRDDKAVESEGCTNRPGKSGWLLQLLREKLKW